MKHLAPYRHALAALAFAVVALAFLGFVPEQRLDKLADLLGRLVEDPDGAIAAITALASVAAAARGLWMRKPPSDPPSTPPSGSDGPPTTPRRRHTLPPDRIERDADLVGPGHWERVRERMRAMPRRTDFIEGSLPPPLCALVVLTLALTGCGASALRTHSTIATVARVSVVTAGEAIARTCEVALSRCTDEACIERTSADCTVAGTAAEAAIDGVRAYVDVIEVAALADEGQVAASLDLAVQAMARLYEALRDALASLPSLGVTLPPLPPIAVALLRALAEQITGGAS